MRVRDQQAWAEQLLEFEADETSQKFRDFLLFWFETADRVIKDQVTEMGFRELGWGDDEKVYAEIIRNTFWLTEQTMGYICMEWIGQMLVVASGHWEHGEAMVRGLTTLESRMLQQMTAVKLVELQASASMPVDERK